MEKEQNKKQTVKIERNLTTGEITVNGEYVGDYDEFVDMNEEMERAWLNNNPCGAGCDGSENKAYAVAYFFNAHGEYFYDDRDNNFMNLKEYLNWVDESCFVSEWMRDEYKKNGRFAKEIESALEKLKKEDANATTDDVYLGDVEDRTDIVLAYIKEFLQHKTLNEFFQSAEYEYSEFDEEDDEDDDEEDDED